jgi:hypothetical protein
MPEIYELEKIRELIKRPCNTVRCVSFVVNNYNNVLKHWKSYKNGDYISDKNLRDIFDFHNTNCNHILLYWSANQEDCLLMCKISNKYINLRMPMLIKDTYKSFIATYT